MSPNSKTPFRRHHCKAITASTVALAMVVFAFSISLVRGEVDADVLADAREHWAFSRLEYSESRSVEVAEIIDDYFQSGRKRLGISQPPLAKKRLLVRRLYMDLTGLPPTLEQIQSFENDSSPDAYRRLVLHLTDQPEFGECWGRHWLDVARYADSNGCSIESNNTFDDAWRYRDWVIDAFNRDKPYDQFVRQQVAGDLLPYVSTLQRCEQLIATTFLQLGPKPLGTGNTGRLKLDIVDEQIDSVGKAFLGLSLGCARCHDHKLEPVSTEDYYGLAGIFSSTVSLIHKKGWRSGRTWYQVELPVLDEAASKTLKDLHQAKLERAKSGELKKVADAAYEAAKEELKKLQEAGKPDAEKIAAAERRIAEARLERKNAAKLAKVLPQINPVPAAMAVIDVEKPSDEAIRIGGEFGEKGAVVPRSIPKLFQPSSPSQFSIGETESGRRQLADWIVDTEKGMGNLAARVMVNRIWQHLMGKPLVESSDNFGLTGVAPQHPDLIDRLAVCLIQRDWSTKTFIQQVVLSQTYMRASITTDAMESIHAERDLASDPANHWLWHYQPRRQQWESLRDSILAISGQLDRQRGGKTLQHQGLISIDSDMIELGTPSPYLRRSVYLPVVRDAVGIDPMMDDDFDMRSAFDFACPNLVAGNRAQSLVPAQPLFLMNSEFILEQSDALAKRLERMELENPQQRIVKLFQMTLLRDPTPDEMDASADLVDRLDSDSQSGWSGLCQALLTCNEFLFVE